MKPKLKITVSGGKISVEVEGAKGKSCLKMAEKYLKALGIDPNDVVAKPEMAMAETPAVSQRRLDLA